MTINPTSGALGAFGADVTSGTSSGTSAAGISGADKDMFLSLMVTQLKNQDPMNPQDSSEFLAQTAQFTSLEKLEQVAAQTERAYTAQMAFGASSLVGRTVTYTDAEGAERSGTVSSVRFGAAGPSLTVDGDPVAMDKVTAVQASAPSSNDASTSPTSTT